MGDPMFSQLLAFGLTRVRCDFKTFYLLRVILVSFQDCFRVRISSWTSGVRDSSRTSSATTTSAPAAPDASLDATGTSVFPAIS